MQLAVFLLYLNKHTAAHILKDRRNFTYYGARHFLLLRCLLQLVLCI